MAFMSPRFRDINAANDKSAPCFPASAPICITPTGPARFPAFCPRFEKSLAKPAAVLEKSRANSRLARAHASRGPDGTSFSKPWMSVARH